MVVSSRGRKKGESSPFPSNRISNTKYTLLTFVPKNLYEQFSLHMNRYFLLIAVLELFPSLTPVNPLSTWLPLLFILSVSAAREAVDDYYRYLGEDEEEEEEQSD